MNMNLKKKMLMACFFVMLMLMVPITTVVGYTSTDDKSTNEEPKSLDDSSYFVDGKVILSESHISELEELVNSFEDEESRLIAQDIVNQLVKEDGELDLVKLEAFLNDGYKPVGIVKNLIGQIIRKITDKIMQILLQLIQEWIANRFYDGRSGWLEPTARYCYNVIIKVQEVAAVLQDIRSEINDIRDAVRSFITFSKDPDFFTLIGLVEAVYQAFTSVIALWEDISVLPETVRGAVESIYANTTVFALWFVPDLVDPVNFTEVDRPYNKPIHLNLQILEVEPEDMANIEILCDSMSYTPSPDGTLEIDYITIDETISFWIHNVLFILRDNNKNPPVEIYITDTAFSIGYLNKTIDFSGKPYEPHGPNIVTRLDTHLYETYAISPFGEETIYFKWNWGESMSDWITGASGSAHSCPHMWLTLGEHAISVKAKGDGWESDWSESFTVTVEPIFQIFGNQYSSQPSSQPSSEPSSQPGSQQQGSTSNK